MAVRDFDAFAVVNLEEHRLHQLNALSLFGAIIQRERFYGYQEAVAKERYGDNAGRVLAGSLANRNRMVEEAREEFYRSIGFFAVEASAAAFPEFDVEAYRAEAKQEWVVFMARYRSENRSGRRHTYMQELLQGTSAEEVKRNQATFNRAYDLRPYISEKDQRRIATETGKEYPLLDTRERLQALFDDPRAGFLPTTNREKVMVFTYLDYLDNPDYPLGITNQLFEVLIHQQRLDKIKPGDSPEVSQAKRARQRNGLHVGKRSLESITYEMGDFMESARHGLESLAELRTFLYEGHSPKVSLAEEVPLEEHGLRALIRYRDLARYRDKGELPHGVNDPLRTKENRVRKEADRTVQDSGANKTVEDLYTRTTPDASMDAYVAACAEGMTIGQARKIIDDAIADQQARYAFFRRELQNLVEKTPEARTLTIRQIASDILDGSVTT